MRKRQDRMRKATLVVVFLLTQITMRADGKGFSTQPHFVKSNFELFQEDDETFSFDSEDLFNGSSEESVIGEKKTVEEWEESLVVHLQDAKKEASSETSLAPSVSPRRQQAPSVPRNAKRPKVTQREGNKKEEILPEVVPERGKIAEQPISQAEETTSNPVAQKTFQERRAEKMRAIRAQRPGA